MMIRSMAASTLSRRLQGRPLTSTSSVFRLKNCSVNSVWQPSSSLLTSVRWYTPMTKEEEESEKARASHITPEEKDKELRQLNREISRLEMLRGINNGELYTWSGRYKGLMRDYGFPLVSIILFE
jgi:hypothetical protein